RNYISLNDVKIYGPTISLEEWIPAEVKRRLGNEADYVHPKARTTRRLREFAKADELAKREIRQRFVVRYTIQNDGERVILRGVDENRDSLYVVLDRVKKDYKISPGKLVAGQYE